jgi:ribonuclease HI
MIWLACHNAIPTLSLLHHHQMATSSTCPRCGDEEETTLHCLRDCRFSSQICNRLGFADQNFYSEFNPHTWIKNHAAGTLSSLFLAGLWWTWRNRNSMCLSHESLSLPRIIFNIHSSVDDIETAFHSAAPVQHSEQTVRWNSNNANCVVLNVDGSCLGSPIRAGYGGILRNPAGFFIEGFSGYIGTTTDILFAELTAIHKGLLIAIEKGIEVLICYTDSLLSVKLLSNSTSRFHAYAVLIQDIQDLLASKNFTIHHCFREGNQCADYMAKLGATSNEEFVKHSSPPHDLLPLIRLDAMETVFPRA